jgi:hypothetical protein
MPSSSKLFFYCDMTAAMAAGLVFYRSASGVLFCAGNVNGVVPSRFLRLVETYI